MKLYLLLVPCVLLLSRCGNTVADNEVVASDAVETLLPDEAILEDFKKELSENDYKEALHLKQKLVADYFRTDATEEAISLWTDYLKVNPDIAEEIKLEELVEKHKDEIANSRASLNILDAFFKNGFPKYEIMVEVDYFELWYTDILIAMKTPDSTNKALATELNRKLIERKKERFPILRQQFANEADKLLWRDNIDVVVSGERSDVLTITAGMFASNANIEDFQNTISEKLRKLRFKRVNYKWYEYDDDYTYYNVNSKSDDT